MQQPNRMMLRGTVAVGMGKAADFLSIPGYKAGFKRALGYVPYPGTLNVKLFSSYAKKASALKRKAGIRVSGFNSEGKRFGAVRCYPAILNGRISTYVISPERSRYPPSVIEIVSKKRLKGGRIKSGSTIFVEVRLA